MAMIGYVARVLTGVRFKKMNHMIDVVHQKCGQNKVRTFFDMLWCAVRYGAGFRTFCYISSQFDILIWRETINTLN